MVVRYTTILSGISSVQVKKEKKTILKADQIPTYGQTQPKL